MLIFYKKIFNEFPPNTPENLEDLITKCWYQNPDLRPNFTYICDLLESPKFVTSSINRHMFREVFTGCSTKNIGKVNELYEKIYSIRHPCICQPIGITFPKIVETEDDEDDEINSITVYNEYLPFTLEKVIENGLIDNTLKTRVVIEICHALNYINKKGISHCFMNIFSIMFNSVFEAKIIDLFTNKAKKFFRDPYEELNFCMEIGCFLDPYNLKRDQKEIVDTFNEKIDSYSFGVLLFVLFTGKNPYSKMIHLFKHLPIEMPEKSKDISQCTVELITKCMNNNPYERPGFDEILHLIRKNSYMLADEVDAKLVKKRDDELSFYEEENL